jgi:hypothetical protein
MSDNRQVVNAVRQVIINELGISRASIRAEVDSQIRQLCSERVDAFLNSPAGNMGDVLIKAVEQYMRPRWGGTPDEVRKIITTAAEQAAVAEAKQIVRGRLAVDITVKPKEGETDG